MCGWVPCVQATQFQLRVESPFQLERACSTICAVSSILHIFDWSGGRRQGDC